MRQPEPLPEKLAKIVNDFKDNKAELKKELDKEFSNIAVKDNDKGIITQTRRYKLITPLFGGGVEPGVNDELTPISGKAIRGHLRFWWRATRGVGTIEEMKKREDEVWGAASTKKKKVPSKVLLELSGYKVGTPDKPFYLRDGNKPRSNPESIVPPYAAFPLQPTDDEIRKAREERREVSLKEVRTDVEFTLQITFLSEERKEIEAALWAWETFGGVGGRTRRGFGALELVWIREGDKDITPEKTKASEVIKEIRQKLKDEEDGGILKQGTREEDIAYLSPDVDMKIRSSFKGRDRNIEAWKFLIEKLRNFRQSRKPSLTKPAGRSHWPEPDMVRRLIGTNKFNHSPLHYVKKFPRAQFGLPIIFHFNRDEMTNGDSFSVELKPINYKRLASPLILRPISCANNESVALALILDAPAIPPNGVELKDYGKVITELDKPNITNIKPMNDSDPNEADVLRSFLETIK